MNSNPRKLITTIFIDIIKKQNKLVSKKIKLAASKIEDLAIDIERGIYNKTILRMQ